MVVFLCASCVVYEYFINVGPKLADQLPPIPDIDPTQHINHAPSRSFMFRAICPQEVFDLIKGLNVNKLD